MLTRQLDNDTHLRLFAPADAAELFALIDRNRNHLRPWFEEMIEATQRPQDTAAWIERMLDGRAREPRGWSGIFQRGVLVGAIGIAAVYPRKQSAQIGYYLAADACGCGLATLACRALLAHLFEELGFHRVDLRTAATNDRSIRLAQRVGFTCEGRLRDADVYDGRRRDLLVFGMLAPEWAARSRQSTASGRQ